MTRENQAVTSDQYWPGPLSNGLIQYQKPDNYRGNHDWVIKPTLLLHSTFGFTRQQQQWDNPLQKGFASKLGLPLSGDSDATPIIAFLSDLPSAGGLGELDHMGNEPGQGRQRWAVELDDAIQPESGLDSGQAQLQDGLGHSAPSHVRE